MPFVLLPEAEADLDDIWLYVARASGSVEIANRLVDTFTDRFLLLGQHPHRGRHRQDLRPGLRSFPVGEHVILYRVEGDTSLILQVLHGRRDVESRFRD